MEEPEWDPRSIAFQEQQEEDSTVDTPGMIHITVDKNSRRLISSVEALHKNQACDCALCNLQRSTMLTEIDPNLPDNFLLRSLKRNVKVSSAATRKRKGNLVAERITKNWSASLRRLCRANSEGQDSTGSQSCCKSKPVKEILDKGWSTAVPQTVA